MAKRQKLFLESHFKIIHSLAKKNELAQYDMAKLLNISYRTVMRRVKELEEHNPPLIKVAREEQSSKKGKARKIYVLTFNGLFFALKIPSLWKRIDEIARRYKDKTFIFKTWHTLTESDKELVKEYFKHHYSNEISLDRKALLFSEALLKEHIESPLIGHVARFYKNTYPILERNAVWRKEYLTRMREDVEESEQMINEDKAEIARLESLS